MLITEVAMRDHQRPSWYVVRASKLLAASAWSGQGYRLRVEQPAEVMALIEEIGIPLLVLDREPGDDWPHHRLLARVIEEFPDRWRLLEHYRGQPDYPGIELFAYRGSRIECFSPARLKQAIGTIGVSPGR